MRNLEVRCESLSMRLVATSIRSRQHLCVSALQKARADQRPRQERAAARNAAGSAGLGMRNLEVRPPPAGLLSDALRSSRLHVYLQSQCGFAHLYTLHLFAGQASPPRSSSFLGAQCVPCASQCRCAACTSYQAPICYCAAGLASNSAVAGAVQLYGCLGYVVLHLDGEGTVVAAIMPNLECS